MSDQTWTITEPQAVSLDDVTAVKLGMISGRFDIRPHAEPGILVDISEVIGDPVAISRVGNHVDIRHQLHGPQGWLKSLMETVSHAGANSAVIHIYYPTDAVVDLEVGTVSGDGAVVGLTGVIRLNTVNGSLTADHTRGELHINTVGGAVSATDHSGVLTAKAVSGVVDASGPMTHVRASTVSGDLIFGLTGQPQDIGTNAVSGNVTITLPADVGADIVAKAASGAVVIENQHFAQVTGTVETILGPDDQLTLIRTNSVSGRTAILHES
ncbi:hypothetical protein PSET11_02196 [Arthrobacter ulcerisalmonis]|uniref:DUF4097 domain-containing protein n=1 Tax=Arthrobacter ulcerisalmonis TaxID=2483813 RepID=A0A3P5X461_9MICC|nr:DUF4097 family beta strand repeat-containing protein [Arthrobacter ulcerisalmonis]VDC29080.1 hypothetical protein PSET11_02196 [Arthrobacter ulcerisalmonis]